MTSHFISSLGQGELHMMPRPHPLRLRQSIEQLKACAITHVVCLLDAREMQGLGLEEEEALCHSTGLKFTHFPISDFSVPPVDAFSALIASLLIDLEQGAHILIHCRGGIGRSGLVACGLLIEWGMSAEEAIALVSERRCAQVPETEEQVKYLGDFEHTRGWSSPAG